MRDFALIVALDEQGGIGKNGDLPWKLSADLKHFRNVTTGDGNNAVIMGRKTWDSIPEKFRPLPGRKNIVISRQTNLELPEDVALANSIEQAIDLAGSCTEIFVIGGGAIYSSALEYESCQKVYMTAIHGNFECDTFFKVDAANWQLVDDSPPQEENGICFSFCVYQKKQTGE